MPWGLIGMYWVKCKQSNFHTSLTTLCSHFLWSYSNQPWLSQPTGGHGHVIYMGKLVGVFSHENTPEGHTETHKCNLFPYKQVSQRNGDHEWLRMTNAFILCDLLWNVPKSHAANREGSFKIMGNKGLFNKDFSSDCNSITDSFPTYERPLKFASWHDSCND